MLSCLGHRGGRTALIAALLLPGPLLAQLPELELLRPERSPVITNVPRADERLLPRGERVAPGDEGRAAAQPTAPPLPPLDRVEFQDLVRLSLGRDLPLFGYDLFQDPVTTFAPVEHVPVPADYVIGPSDELYIRAWGQVDIDYRATVDRDGQIYLPKIGAIGVAGVRFQDLQAHLQRAVSRVFKNFELTVSLGQLRSIQVFVVGQARRPGTYTVSSLSTLVNALFASGGPAAKGSMRRIQLKRNGKLVTEFDLYDLLLRGDKSKDARLLPGDVIFIPPVGARVALSGSVQVPAIYELKAATAVGDLIDMAGGLAATASGDKVTLERIVERRARRVQEFDLEEEGRRQALSDGDLVTVYTLSPRIENAVTLKGNVAQPMRFPWKSGMRVSDVIPEREALIAPDYWLGRNTQGRPLSWLRDGTREPPPTDEARLRREVKRVSADINWDYAVIERLNLADLSTTLVPFNLGRAVLVRNPEDNVALLPGDVITVFSTDDIRVPVAQQTKYVRLEGEFKVAGVYQVQPGETLKQLVLRVGGLTPNAYLFGAEFTRESTRLLQQRQLDEALARLEVEAQRAAVARSQAVISPEEAQALKEQAAAQNALIARLRAIKASGRIVLELPVALKIEAQSLPDITLEDGDRLYVPPLPSTVGVFGSVYNPNAYLHAKGKTFSDYLARAGGPTRDADKGSVYLLRADGSVISKRQSGFTTQSVYNQQLMPGDAVVVPESFERFNFTKELKDWTQILYQLALGVAGLKVLKDL